VVFLIVASAETINGVRLSTRPAPHFTVQENTTNQHLGQLQEVGIGSFMSSAKTAPQLLQIMSSAGILDPELFLCAPVTNWTMRPN
jgi:hypothetical protein